MSGCGTPIGIVDNADDDGPAVGIGPPTDGGTGDVEGSVIESAVGAGACGELDGVALALSRSARNGLATGAANGVIGVPIISLVTTRSSANVCTGGTYVLTAKPVDAGDADTVTEDDDSGG